MSANIRSPPPSWAARANGNVDMSEVTNFASATGKGVTGTVDGRTVAIGNLKHLEALGIDPGQLRDAGGGTAARGPDRHVRRGRRKAGGTRRRRRSHQADHARSHRGACTGKASRS